MEIERAIVLSIVNHKGGVGKTTTVNQSCTCPCSTWGEPEQRLSCACRGFGSPGECYLSAIPTRAGYYSACPRLPMCTTKESLFQLHRLSRQTAVPGLDLIPSSIGLFDVEPDLGPQALRIAMLDTTLLEHTADGPNYDWVLIDTPPNLGVFMLNSLASQRLST